MHRIPRIIWLARYIFLSLLSIKLPKHFICIGKPLLLIGFRRIEFQGRALLFPSSRFEVFKNGRLSIGNDVQIGQQCHITCAQSISIGSNVAIAGNSVITDISHGTLPHTIPPLKRPWSISGVTIEDNCFIGWGAVILPGTHLEKGCTVGANAKVSGHHKIGSVVT